MSTVKDEIKKVLGKVSINECRLNEMNPRLNEDKIRMDQEDLSDAEVERLIEGVGAGSTKSIAKYNATQQNKITQHETQ